MHNLNNAAHFSAQIINTVTDIFRCCGGLIGQAFDLIGDHGKPLAGIPGPGGLDGGIEGKQVGLFGYIFNIFDDLANFFRGGR